MKIKNKFYHFIVSIILVVSLLAGTIVPANTIVKADDNNPTIWTSYEQSNGVVTIHYYGTGITPCPGWSGRCRRRPPPSSPRWRGS